METQYTTITDEQNEPSTSFSYNKYLYPQFAGYEGERLLKSILRKILPMALYRTWEILTERQALGNDCFLSIASIAEIAERGGRTIRLNIHELEARKLLTLRPAHKILRQADDSLKPKVVMVKDFSGLYALAHEYLLWTHSDDYIEPERDFANVIQADKRLKKKLLRFNNYRRIILNQVPGPKPVEREEHRWYTEYDPTEDDQELGTAGGTATPTVTEYAEHAEVQKKTPKWNLYLQENVQEQLKKISIERISTNNQNDRLDRDSFDSEIPSREGGGCGYTKANELTDSEQVRRDARTKPTKTNATNPYPIDLEEGRAEQSPRREQANLDERAQAFVQQAMAAYEATRGDAGRRGQGTAQKAKPNSLVSAFVREVSPVFRDQNLKGSLTRALRAVEQTSLSQKDILACLVKAYLVTQDTKKVHEKYRRPDGDIKMPLFCTMFARFTNDCAAGTFGYTDEHLARDIAEDDRLVLFVVEQKLEATLLEQTTTESQEDALPQDDVQDLGDGAPAACEAQIEDVQVEQSQMEQPVAEKPQPQIEAASPDLGWQTQGSAYWWANRLRDALSRGAYDYVVHPTQYGRYGFVLFIRANPSERWEFLTEAAVKKYL